MQPENAADRQIPAGIAGNNSALPCPGYLLWDAASAVLVDKCL